MLPILTFNINSIWKDWLAHCHDNIYDCRKYRDMVLVARSLRETALWSRYECTLSHSDMNYMLLATTNKQSWYEVMTREFAGIHNENSLIGYVGAHCCWHVCVVCVSRGCTLRTLCRCLWHLHNRCHRHLWHLHNRCHSHLLVIATNGGTPLVAINDRMCVVDTP